MVRAAQGSRRVGSSPCSASDCLCDLGQHTFSRLPGSLAIYEMSSVGQLVALNQGKASELPVGFCKHRLLGSIPRNSDSVGLDLAQGPVLRVESPLVVLIHEPG